MKKILKYSFILFLAVTISCDENEFLKEKAVDFYTPNNALETNAEFQASVNYLYNRLRWVLWGGMNLDTNFAFRYATDFAVNATDYNPPVKLNDYKNTMVPTFFVVRVMWESAYNSLITHANVIIENAPKSQKLTESEKNTFIAEAKFFRAWAYRLLANLYGGVPLVLEQITSPRRDFQRATREEVYHQCKQDLLDAIAVLPDVDKVEDGKVNKQVCQHLLSEIYISLGMYNEAVRQATAVIDYPGLELMKERFGRRKDLPGDVYSDLFVLFNPNRSNGNREGLFVIQAEYNNPGSPQRDVIQWALIPDMGNLRFIEQVNNTSAPAIFAHNSKLSGRGVGWIRPTSHFFYTIWKDDFNGDIRNSEYNIVRDFQIDGVAENHPDYGKWYVKDGYKAKVVNFADTIRNWFPVIKKATLHHGDFSSDWFRKDAAGNVMVSPLNGGNYLVNASENPHAPKYLHRLAETYLLRAEAYLMLNEKQKAANDINELRRRAKTFEINAADVDIDFLLDERLRELYAEELRMLTLTRMGLLYDRNVKYNEKSGVSIAPYHNLWPIPFQEIERNVDARIEQNPGYAN